DRDPARSPASTYSPAHWRNLTMTSPVNGSPMTSNSDRPAIRQPAEATIPEATAPGAMERDPASLVSSSLAEETVRQRTERQNRDLLIGAGYRLKDRVSHPDGGDSSVENTAARDSAEHSSRSGK